MIGVKRPKRARPARLFATLPRGHLVAVAMLAAAFGVGLSLTPAENVEANRKSVPVALPALEEPAPTVPAGEPERERPWRKMAVKYGDNLSLIFQRAGLTDADVYHIVNRAEGGKSLRRIHPGQALSFQLDDNGDLAALRHELSVVKSVVYQREGDAYRVETVERTPEVHRDFHSATIQSSLYEAGLDAGMSQNTIMELANIFGGVIDFVLDPRRGDSFHVLHEELYLDGRKYRDGKVLAAEFVNRGRRFTAFRYIDDQGRAGYFSEDGVSMRKAFLLAPVDFTRISSNFDQRRLHPIYKTRRPHRGIDYAAPRGTPVFAAGDGRVTEAGYTRANGNYVVLRHGEAYTTKYLHLHKRKVKKNQRVSQNQIIGTVGSTGAATGPHLHYEFLVNGVHRNPRTIHRKLPKARSLAAAELPRFMDQTRGLRMQLASISRQALALNRTAPQ